MTRSVPPSEPNELIDQPEIWHEQEGTGSDPERPEREPTPPSGPAARPPAWTQSLTSTAPVPGPSGFYYADVPNRVIAYIVDDIVLAIIGFLLAIVLGGLLGGVTTSPSLDSAGGDLNVGAFLIVGIAGLAISFVYFGYFWTSVRATPGMKLLGLQIGDEADGHSIDWRQASVRWFILGIPSILATFASYVSSGIGFILSLIGIIWLIVLLYSIAQSPTKQGLHDRYAHTIIVKAARRVA